MKTTESQSSATQENEWDESSFFVSDEHLSTSYDNALSSTSSQSSQIKQEDEADDSYSAYRSARKAFVIDDDDVDDFPTCIMAPNQVKMEAVFD